MADNSFTSSHCYAVEPFFNPLLFKMWGKELETFLNIQGKLMDKFGVWHERRLIYMPPEEYWRLIKVGLYASEEFIKQKLAEIAERFKQINEDAMRVFGITLFPDPEDVVVSYFFRDVLMIFDTAELAQKICRSSDTILAEFKASKQSPTLKALIGDEKYEALIKNYHWSPPPSKKDQAGAV